MGICRGGKTLKDLIDRRDGLFRETGHLWGLEKLELLETDPVKFDRFQWKLLAAVYAARENSKLVSASPAGVGMGELLDLLALPEGDVVAASMGLQGHVGCMPHMIRSIAELGYEDDPGMGGIRDGDIYHCNDPVYGCPHPADNYTFLPVFYRDDLVAWTCGLNHVADIGAAICPGALPSHSPTVYFDGFVVPPTKTGQNFTQARWWAEHWKRRTRSGVFNILDDKMRVTGAIMLRDRVLEIVEEFGVEYFERALREILERERREILNRIRREMVPGRYCWRSFKNVHYKDIVGPMFPEAARDYLLHHHNDTTITPQGTIHCDFGGSSSQGYHHLNSYVGAHGFGQCGSLFTFLAHSPMVNTSLHSVLTHDAPAGSIFNPSRSDLGCGLGLVNALEGYELTAYALALSRFARGFLEEAYTWEIAYQVYAMQGVFGNGTPWAISEFTLAGSEPVGASAWRDGFPHLTGPGNPEGDSGETEEWEFVEPPLLTIGKRQVPDFFCHGRYRGSIGTCLTHLVVEPGRTLSLTISAMQRESGTVAIGMCGGYPIGSNYNAVFRGTNARQLIAQGVPLPRDFTEIWKAIEDGTLRAERILEWGGEVPPTLLGDGDLVTQAVQANSAWGDPLDRDPKLVEADLNGEVKADHNVGWTSAEVAERIYGVVAKRLGSRWVVDDAATEQRRRALREERERRSIPAKDWWREERQRVLDKGFPTLVYETYKDCLEYEKFRREWTEFWQPGHDYRL